MTARPRFAQFCLQFFLLLSPARPPLAISCRARRGLFRCHFQILLRDRARPARARLQLPRWPARGAPFSLPVGPLPAALAVAPLLLLLERACGLAGGLVVDCLRRRLRPLRRTLCRRMLGLAPLALLTGRSVGSWACSLKAPVEPTGQRNATPRWAIVGSSDLRVFAERPWQSRAGKRLFLRTPRWRCLHRWRGNGEIENPRKSSRSPELPGHRSCAARQH